MIRTDNFDMACMVDEVGYLSGPRRHVFFVRVVMVLIKEGVVLIDRFDVDISVQAQTMSEFRWSISTVKRLSSHLMTYSLTTYNRLYYRTGREMIK